MGGVHGDGDVLCVGAAEGQLSAVGLDGDRVAEGCDADDAELGAGEQSEGHESLAKGGVAGDGIDVCGLADLEFGK